MAKTYTPLRYPGGKSSLAGFVKLLLKRNHLVDGEYAEAFCGGAGVAMDLLRSQYVHRVHLNDVDPAIHAFWWSVFNEPEELCRRISTAKLSIPNWRRQRAILAKAAESEMSELGFAALYLNRVNRSGILSAGPIGGLAQDGEWQMDARFNRAALIDQVQALARLRERVCLYRVDALAFLKNVVPKLSRHSLLYLDPPYVVQGKRLYLNAYAEKDHAAIAGKVQTICRVPWLVSYDNVPLIRELYSERRHWTYSIDYSANQRSEGREIMVFSDDLELPRVRTPLSIHGTELKRLLAAA